MPVADKQSLASPQDQTGHLTSDPEEMYDVALGGSGREDAMIAATAAVHGLTVVTRNTRDFDRLGVPTPNPFR